jgi:hypothetical protein
MNNALAPGNAASQKFHTDLTDRKAESLQIQQQTSSLFPAKRSPRETLYIYQAQCPPSIRRSDPVMKLLASLIKNTAAPLYSSGLLSLSSIFCFGHSSFRSGYSTNNASTIAVTMYPGLMVFTRMPYMPHSEARLRASWTTPAFEAL